jgi:hypothetical protein
MSNSAPTLHGMRFDGMEDPEIAQLVAQLLEAEIQQEAQQAADEQVEIARQLQSNPVTKAIDGLGPQVLAIHPTAYLHYKVREQFDFSSARDRRWLATRHPDMKVPECTVKNTFGYVSAFQGRPPVFNAPQREVFQAPERTRAVRETVKFNP